MKNISDKSPVNKTAALVVSKGFDYIPEKKIETRDSSNPIAIRNIDSIIKENPSFKNLKGIKFGRFVVIGLARDFKGCWVVRCQCGIYSTRRKKAILNKENVQDRCDVCRHLVYLKRKDYFIQTGKDKDVREF